MADVDQAAEMAGGHVSAKQEQVAVKLLSASPGCRKEIRFLQPDRKSAIKES